MGTNRYNRPATRDARRLGFRSGLEANAAEQLVLDKVEFEYESDQCKFTYYKNITNGKLIHKDTLEYIKIPKEHKVAQRCIYTCDFLLRVKDKIIFIETKGHFKPADRAKHKLIRDQHPEVDLRLVFSSNGIIKKGENGVHYRHADWAKDEGFQYHIVNKKSGIIVPKEWYNE